MYWWLEVTLVRNWNKKGFIISRFAALRVFFGHNATIMCTRLYIEKHRKPPLIWSWLTWSQCRFSHGKTIWKKRYIKTVHCLYLYTNDGHEELGWFFVLKRVMGRPKASQRTKCIALAFVRTMTEVGLNSGNDEPVSTSAYYGRKSPHCGMVECLPHLTRCGAVYVNREVRTSHNLILFVNDFKTFTRFWPTKVNNSCWYYSVIIMLNRSKGITQHAAVMNIGTVDRVSVKYRWNPKVFNKFLTNRF